MATVGLVADVDREIAAGESEIAVTAGGTGITTAIVAAANDLVQFAAGAEPAAVDTCALAALAVAAVLIAAAAGVISALGEARGVANAGAARITGGIAATIGAAILPRRAAIARHADTFAKLCFRTGAILAG